MQLAGAHVQGGCPLFLFPNWGKIFPRVETNCQFKLKHKAYKYKE